MPFLVLFLGALDRLAVEVETDIGRLHHSGSLYQEMHLIPDCSQCVSDLSVVGAHNRP
jgi:hypothetical protein